MLFYNNNAKSYAESTFNTEFAKTVFLGMEKCLMLNPEDKTILDIGCGSGRDANHLISLGYKVDAFDQSEAMIEQAKSLTGLNDVFHVGSAQNFVANKTYDFAYSIACLLHLDDKEFINAIENIKSHLNDNGQFYFTVKKGIGEELDEAGRYFNYYTIEKLEYVCKKLELLVLDISENPDLTRPDTTWLNVWVQKA